MTQVRRILAVTAGLALVGAITGAVCGVLALVPLFGLPGLSFAGVAESAPQVAAAGAALGVFFGPLLAWTMLPHVPLWRVILWAAVGTELGAVYGLAAASMRLVPAPLAVFGGALIGLAVAGTALRRRVARASSGNHPESVP